MSKALLGDTIDLHTGGVDLLFPHHENEIAQSQCCNGKTFSTHWYHSEHLLVDGTTMSKSKGNYYNPRRPRPPKATRRWPCATPLLMGHPRKQLNFTLDGIHAGHQALVRLGDYSNSLYQFCKVSPNDIAERETNDWGHFSRVIESLRDDLNTPKALGELFQVVNDRTLFPRTNDEAVGTLVAFNTLVRKVLGLGLIHEVHILEEANAEG